MSELVSDFLGNVEAKDGKLAQRLGKVAGEDAFHVLLSRFDYSHTDRLDDSECALALRVLSKLHTPSAKGIDLLVKTLDYLDVNESQTLEHPELTLAVEILELFCKADSVNDTLSTKELDMLLSVLGKIDADGNGVLDEKERTALRDGLWTPDEFLAKML